MRPSVKELRDQLQDNGLRNAILSTEAMDKLHSRGRAVVEAVSQKGGRVAVHVMLRGTGRDPDQVANDIVRLSPLSHPHLLLPKSFSFSPDFLFVVTDYADGGDLFSMVRRGGDAGLPAPAARFLFQQLILALEFCHAHNIYIRNINPSSLLIFWNDKGMPILKISDFRVSKDTARRGAASTPVAATMYTCPHMIRQAYLDRKDWEDLAAVCDVWSATVTLFFMLTGRWPFSKEQITAWASTPAERWDDDTAAMASIAGAQLPEEVEGLFRDVFALGRCSAGACLKPHATRLSISGIIQMPWCQEDLPPGAEQMTSKYLKSSEQAKSSESLQHLQALVRQALASAKAPRHNGGGAGGVAAAPPSAACEAQEAWHALAAALATFLQAGEVPVSAFENADSQGAAAALHPPALQEAPGHADFCGDFFPI